MRENSKIEWTKKMQDALHDKIRPYHNALSFKCGAVETWEYLAPEIVALKEALRERDVAMEALRKERDTTIEHMFAELEKWSAIYEFSFQFWGPGKNNGFIYKGGIHMTGFGGLETPQEAIAEALAYVHKQNPKGFKQPKTELHYCVGCGARVAPGNDLCGECMCEDDAGF